MKIFGKERDSLRIKRIRASRAMFVNYDVQEIHVKLQTDDGDELVLQLPPRLASVLIGELTDAYEAINPPLSRRYNAAAGWDGEGT